MPTKQEIRKYIHKIKACSRIEVFYFRNDPEDPCRTFHYISRKGEFLGFSIEIPNRKITIDDFVNGCLKYMTCNYKLSEVGDSSLGTVRKYHVRDNRIDGILVKRNGKWIWGRR